MLGRIYESIRWRITRNRYAAFVLKVGELAFNDFLVKRYYQYFPAKPEVINLNANDVCNSGCTMCNIWKNDKSYEVSPDELYKILTDPLFSEVKHIGITGGEPTLRSDLPLLYEAAIKAIPDITGLSIITNAIRTDDVIKRIEDVHRVVTQKHGKYFSMMVSLDGVGAMHDQIRGKRRNFESAIEVINHFKNKNIPIAVGCTISKENVFFVDDLLDYMVANNIYGRFRVAEFIARLYNADRTDVIRNYTPEEAYHLACFFKKLELTFEKNEVYKRTYRSIISVLLGGERLIACPFKSKGVVLDSRGDLQYCAPKSPIIGNALSSSANSIYKSKLPVRRQILANDCSNCIHDYHAPITLKEFIEYESENYFKGLIAIENLPRNLLYSRLLKPLLKKPACDGPLVFIVGWYGTETVGDKAILKSIINDFKRSYPGCKIVVSSMYPFVTKQTMHELNETFEVVFTYSKEFFRYAIFADHVVMGGGPLMHINELAIPLIALAIGRQNKRTTWVYGCGIGPLKGEKYESAVKNILNNTTHIHLRDSKSADLAKKWFQGREVKITGDPAVKLLKEIKSSLPGDKGERYVSCFLRELPREYWTGLTDDEYIAMKKNFEASLAALIKEKASALNARIRFYSMHTFVVGNDDRDFYRKFIKDYFSDVPDIYFERKPSSIEQITQAMNTSALCICMRFHSVVFANTLGKDFIAVDYTDGGKIAAYLHDEQALDKLMPVNSFLSIVKQVHGR